MLWVALLCNDPRGQIACRQAQHVHFDIWHRLPRQIEEGGGFIFFIGGVNCDLTRIGLRGQKQGCSHTCGLEFHDMSPLFLLMFLQATYKM